MQNSKVALCSSIIRIRTISTPKESTRWVRLLLLQIQKKNTVLLYEDEKNHILASLSDKEAIDRSLKKLSDLCKALDQSEVLSSTYYPSIIITPSHYQSIGKWIAEMGQDQHPLTQLKTPICIFSGPYVIYTTWGDIINNQTDIDAYQCVLAD